MNGADILKVLVGAMLFSTLIIAAAIVFGYERPGVGDNPETIHEKRVFTAPGCVIWQVTIRNEYGFDQIYVATTNATENRPTSAYPACRVTK